jgi:hypothetical protein
MFEGAIDATGALLGGGDAVIVIVSEELSTLPSFTIRLTVYVPTASAVNVGFIPDESDKTALLPDGLEIKVHAYVNGLPSGSLLALPVRVTPNPDVMS